MKTAPAKTAPAKPAGIATLGVLAGIAKPAVKKSSAKTYPAIPDPEHTVAPMADQLAEEIAEFKALEASVLTLKGELIALGRQQFYAANHGKADPYSSVEARGDKSIILVSFQNRYPGSADPEQVTEIIGDAAAAYFRQSFALKIDGDKIPADEAEEVIQAIAEILASHNCGDALSAKAVICPNAEYHTARHKFTPEQNLQLDRLVPPVAVVRIKAAA
jgi:hypothetical protein